MTIFLAHSKVQLALHTLRSGDGQGLLILHALGGESPETVPEGLGSWSGPIYALDFTGHGQSSVPAGGGYTAEALMGDADVTLSQTGPCTIVGYGLGAYIALMCAGGRPMLTRGAVLLDGRGLSGGGTMPRGVDVRGAPEQRNSPDPFALIELAEDLRPPDYAASFVKVALDGSGLELPVSVCCEARPGWLEAVLLTSGAAPSTLEAALSRYAATNVAR